MRTLARGMWVKIAANSLRIIESYGNSDNSFIFMNIAGAIECVFLDPFVFMHFSGYSGIRHFLMWDKDQTAGVCGVDFRRGPRHGIRPSWQI